ncbi:pantoate--beta-alanine ligase [Wenzhouxiangella marina]|nr:pantoate--beta-alanine ligase [Wenzhouxiangella marina]MBB6086951.1 pantoate--beta-alanine ligase [Wenzhouxiangella marina]
MKLGPTHDLAELRRTIRSWQADGQRVGFVPTMGNLHAGHLALVDRLRKSCDRVVTSIFVNPTQFGPNEDFAAYPRTLEADLAALTELGADLAWVPSVETMYPLAESFMVRAPKALADTLCGADRPGHFDGVASVVLRLFLQVAPDAAIFGEKDFQQLLIIRELVRDYALDIDIESLPTVREVDGLAMSSRNQYLSAEERARAPALHAVLRETAAALAEGDDWATLQRRGFERLSDAGFEPQYLEWRSAETLGVPEAGRPQRLLAAARLGKARLIDNLAVDA